MQVELKSIQRDVGITFVFVTHDQGEALSMSDRVAVFNNGCIEQVGTPREIYDQPATAFVAGFVGSSNLLSPDESERILGVRATHTIRPERVRVVVDADVSVGEVVVSGTVADIQYTGADSRIRIQIEGESANGRHLLASVPSDGLAGVAIGGAIRLAWPRTAAFIVADNGSADNETTGGDES
ncbi:MAG: potA [Acidimicrobiaceae bacterium]|nr:MAG: potA [Acidimicrobiaceae bacterium]